MTKTAGPMATSISQVYTTTDYFLFKSIDGNRNLNLQHLNRLKRSIAEHYLFTIIIVNENREIIDGQHRFECIKELGLPLHYVICNGYGLKEVHLLNANSQTWKADDYLDGYCRMGYEQYISYAAFKAKYGLDHSVCLALLQAVNGGPQTKAFYEGKFKITDLASATRKIELIKQIEPYYEGYKRRSFVHAMIRLIDNRSFSFSEFLAKLKAQPNTLIDCPSSQSYVVLIEKIYNYRRREKVNLRF